MSEGWAILRSWTDAELARELRRACALPRNFEAPPEEMSRARGWNQVESHSLVAHESRGPPAELFTLLLHALERFEHSDPRIVIAHFDGRAPLLGRTLLLELIAAGLHFLAPVRVAAVRRDPHVLGFCVDTLQGHIETGREWFLLQKDPDTGAIRLRIEAAWGHGQFPGWWARLGFSLVGRRYQRAWHRLAHARMRRLAHEARVPGAGGAFRHAGTPLPLGPVQFYATRALHPRAAHLERERAARPTRH